MKKPILYLLTVLALLGCKNEPTGREQLLQRLQTLQEKGCMFGHQDDPFYGIGWAYEDGRSDVLETCGDWPAVMGFDLGGIEMGDSKNLDSVPFDCIRTEIIRHHQRGGIVTVSWHPRNPVTGGTAWDATDGVVKAILAQGETHEIFMTWLERVRSFLLTLVDENGHPVPLIFRPWHENNGGWFWWGEKQCNAEEFKALYALTQDYINLPNILWSYSPNLDGAMTEERFLKRYPGDERVDLIGLDAYQWGTEEDFIRQTRVDLDCFCRFGHEHHKLVALTECGYRSVPDPTWWTRVLLPIVEDYPLSYALVWRNAEKGEHFGPVPDTEGARDFQAFHNSSRTLFLQNIIHN